MVREVLEDLGEPVPVARGLEGARGPGEQPGRLLAGHEFERAAVGGDRRDGVVEPLEEQVAPLGGERGALGRGRLEPLPIGEQVARLLPALPRQRQPGEAGEGVGVVGEDLADPPELHGRLLLGSQLLLGELGRADPQRPLLGGLPGECVGRPDEQRVELGVGPGAGGQVLHPAAGLGVAGRLGQRLGGGVERTAGVAEPVLADGGDVEPHARAVGRVGRLVAGDHLEHLDVASGVASGRVDGRQGTGDAHRVDAARQEILERPDRLGGQRRGEAASLEQRQPGAGGVEGARQRVEEKGRPLGVEVGAIRGALGRETRQDLAELACRRLGAVGAQRRGEPAQRLRIGAVLGEHVPPGALGPRRVARLQVEPRDLDGELATVGSGGRGHPAGQVLDELGLAPGAGERGLVGAGRSAVGRVENRRGCATPAPPPRRARGRAPRSRLPAGAAPSWSRGRLPPPQRRRGRPGRGPCSPRSGPRPPRADAGPPRAPARRRAPR